MVTLLTPHLLHDDSPLFVVAQFMLRGLGHLCKYMPEPKDARRLFPDPENEPDFYRISQMFPVPAGDREQATAAATLPSTELPQPNKVPRVMIGAMPGNFEAAEAQVVLANHRAAADVSQARARLSAAALQLTLEQEARRLQEQQQQNAALAVYADLVRGSTTLSDVLKRS